ncbi:unnamed protein product [Polarella glacialis]|uniref:Uncharacterized protein n=1 Tax=Polarella glacialis TaxID=89957 RepID=A0A813JA94_POLGL|nr:unnamed protein product [Polarella glacialis]
MATSCHCGGTDFYKHGGINTCNECGNVVTTDRKEVEEHDEAAVKDKFFLSGKVPVEERARLKEVGAKNLEGKLTMKAAMEQPDFKVPKGAVWNLAASTLIEMAGITAARAGMNYKEMLSEVGALWSGYKACLINYEECQPRGFPKQLAADSAPLRTPNLWDGGRDSLPVPPQLEANTILALLWMASCNCSSSTALLPVDLASWYFRTGPCQHLKLDLLQYAKVWRSNKGAFGTRDRTIANPTAETINLASHTLRLNGLLLREQDPRSFVSRAMHAAGIELSSPASYGILDKATEILLQIQDFGLPARWQQVRYLTFGPADKYSLPRPELVACASVLSSISESQLARGMTCGAEEPASMRQNHLRPESSGSKRLEPLPRPRRVAQPVLQAPPEKPVVETHAVIRRKRHMESPQERRDNRFKERLEKVAKKKQRQCGEVELSAMKDQEEGNEAAVIDLESAAEGLAASSSSSSSSSSSDEVEMEPKPKSPKSKQVAQLEKTEQPGRPQPKPEGDALVPAKKSSLQMYTITLGEEINQLQDGITRVRLQLIRLKDEPHDNPRKHNRHVVRSPLEKCGQELARLMTRNSQCQVLVRLYGLQHPVVKNRHLAVPEGVPEDIARKFKAESARAARAQLQRDDLGQVMTEFRGGHDGLQTSPASMTAPEL